MHPYLAAKVEAEVDKLVNIGFVREVKYPIWLAKVVLVKKKKWQTWVRIAFQN